MFSDTTAMAGVTLFIGPEHDHIYCCTYVELKFIRYIIACGLLYIPYYVQYTQYIHMIYMYEQPPPISLYRHLPPYMGLAYIANESGYADLSAP